jgi:6-phosphogluconate dehydrogenase
MQPTVGIVGLGAMGFNSALNMARQGFSVAGYDVDAAKVAALTRAGLAGVHSLAELLDCLERPRRIILLAPAEYTEAILAELAPRLDGADALVDMGNSYFKDTERRQNALAAQGLSLIGCGVSGGYAGALNGPCLMPGGDRRAWERVAPVFAAAAAKVDGIPCTAYIGPGGAGHYVKMVHNGIYYGDSQVIAEAYHILRSLLGLSPAALAPIFAAWDHGRLNSYLIEMTADLLGQVDAQTGQPVVDTIMDRAEQKGSGKWASQTSMDVGAPVGTINAALFARQVSFLKGERVRASGMLPGPTAAYRGDPQRLIDAVRDALYLSKVCSYAQGFTLLKMGSDEYGFGLNLEEIATIWRGGCLIRAGLLEEIRIAFHRDPALPNLLLDAAFVAAAGEMQENLRFVLATAITHGIPVPAMSASLAFYDSYRTATLPANVIQAQRDYFGAHSFERVDMPGHFHRDWQAAKAGA